MRITRGSRFSILMSLSVKHNLKTLVISINVAHHLIFKFSILYFDVFMIDAFKNNFLKNRFGITLVIDAAKY